MKGRLDKETGIALVCYCRQAERSVDRILGGGWPYLLGYYDEPKRSAIAHLIRVLKDAGATIFRVAARDSLETENPVLTVFWNLFGRLVNKKRKSWRFSQDQLSFVRSTLETFLNILELAEPPPNHELAALRLDLHICHRLISWNMLGVPGIRDAIRIGHLGQPEFLEHVTLEEMGVDHVGASFHSAKAG